MAGWRTLAPRQPPALGLKPGRGARAGPLFYALCWTHQILA